MSRYAAGEIHFNLMAIVADVKMTLEKNIEILSKQLEVDVLDQDTGKYFSKY